MIELIFKLLSSNWILALEDKNCQQIIRTDNFNHDGEGKIKPRFYLWPNFHFFKLWCPTQLLHHLSPYSIPTVRKMRNLGASAMSQQGSPLPCCWHCTWVLVPKTVPPWIQLCLRAAEAAEDGSEAGAPTCEMWKKRLASGLEPAQL